MLKMLVLWDWIQQRYCVQVRVIIFWKHFLNPNSIAEIIKFLDRHHAWRSLDPTLDIWSNFVKIKSIKRPLFPFTSFVALVAMSQGFPKVPQGSPRFPKVSQGSPRFPKVPQGSQRLPKSVHYFLLFFPFCF